MSSVFKNTLHAALIGSSFLSFGMVSNAKASDLELGLSGVFSSYGVYNNQDEPAGTSFRGFDLRREAEVHFKGETTLDNGLTTGVALELDVFRADAGSPIAEGYGFLEGGWGHLRFGEDDGVSYLLQVEAPSADENIDGLRQQINSFDLGQLLGANTGLANNRLDYDHGVSGKANKLSYMSPVFKGTQIGVTYVPAISEADQTNVAAITSDNDANEYDDGVELAAYYEREVGEVEMKLGVGYSDYNRETTGVNQDDRQAWNAGIDLGWNQFGLGFAYLEDNNGISNNGDTSTFVVGADYKINDAYRVGLSYLQREDDQNAGTHTTAGDIELARWTGGVEYSFASGMRFNSALSFIEAESGAAGDDERDGYQFSLGMNVDF